MEGKMDGFNLQKRATMLASMVLFLLTIYLPQLSVANGDTQVIQMSKQENSIEPAGKNGAQIHQRLEVSDNRRNKKSGETESQPLSSHFCPHSTEMCPDGQTCCWMYSQCWGCCPYSNAVCCPDHIHCCPEGYTCGAEFCSCSHGSSIVRLEYLHGACVKRSLMNYFLSRRPQGKL